MDSAKAWDAVTCERPVMSSPKVLDPFFSYFAAGQLRGLLRKLQNDTLGLWQRLTRQPYGCVVLGIYARYFRAMGVAGVPINYAGLA